MVAIDGGTLVVSGFDIRRDAALCPSVTARTMRRLHHLAGV